MSEKKPMINLETLFGRLSEAGKAAAEVAKQEVLTDIARIKAEQANQGTGPLEP